jgi:hypothetical protein
VKGAKLETGGDTDSDGGGSADTDSCGGDTDSDGGGAHSS